MKEYQMTERVVGLRGRTKRTLVAVIAILMTLMLSTVALADNGRGGQPNYTKTQPDGEAKGGTSTPNDASGKQNGKRNAEMEGLNVEKIEAAIATLTDEDAKASLATLLAAYVDAWTAKQEAVAAKDTDAISTLADAMTAAKTALDAALETAGISTDTLYGVPEEAKDGTGRTNNRPTLDTDEILAAINSLDDTDANKATLTTLLAAYQDALAAQSGADTSGMTAEEIQALADAVDQAEAALLEAARDAGVIGGLGRGQFVSGYAYGNAEMNMVAIEAQIAGLSDTDENKATLNALMVAYQNALQAEADGSSLSEEERAALRQTTEAAADALKEAMENAGLDTEVQNRAQEQKTYELQVISGDDSATTQDSGLFTTFLNWLKLLLN